MDEEKVYYSLSSKLCYQNYPDLFRATCKLIENACDDEYAKKFYDDCFIDSLDFVNLKRSGHFQSKKYLEQKKRDELYEQWKKYIKIYEEIKNFEKENPEFSLNSYETCKNREDQSLELSEEEQKEFNYIQ